jgi:hypothetical protein
MKLKTLLITGVILAATLGLAAETVTSHAEKTFPAKAGGTVRVEAAFQDVTVTVRPGDTVKVTVDLKISTWPMDAKKILDAYAPVFKEKGDTLLIRSKAHSSWQVGWFNNEGRIDIQMPPGMNVSLDTGSGDCRLDGDTNGMDVSCDTGSGDVKIEGKLKNFKVDTGSGDVTARLERPAQKVHIDTGSGDVDFNGGARDFYADTGSGDVTAVGLLGTAKFDTGSGDVKAEWASLSADASVKIDTGSGQVRLRMPANTVLSGSVEADSGDIHSDFQGTTAEHGHRLTFPGGPGACALSVGTGSGDITLVKKGA